MLDPQPIDYRKNITLDLQRKLFTSLVTLAAAVAWAGLWVTILTATHMTAVVFLIDALIGIICLVTYQVHRRYFRLAVTIFLISLWLSLAAENQLLNSPAVLYFFAIVCLMASLLTDRITSIAVLGASLAYLAAFGPALTWDTLIFSPITAVGGIWLIGTIVFYRVQAALDVDWSYQNYIVRQMNEAREHRGQLMRLTRTLQETQHDLQQANTHLRHARNAAEESRRLKAQFAANVSHELRTPINLIVGFCEMIVTAPEVYGVSLPGAYRADLHAIYRNAKHLQSLINDVLDLSQIEAGRMTVIKEECDPLQVIEEASVLARDLIESKGVKFEVSLPDHLPSMWLDRTRIRQVLLNLLSNAARFTDHGTISLTVAVAKQNLQIVVADTGIGIQESDLTQVFEEFHQLESSLSRRQAGSGLGLTLSREFIHMHGGRIWAESQGLNRGSAFYISLPLSNKNVLWAAGEPGMPASEIEEPKYFAVWDTDPAVIQLFERYSERHRPIPVHSLEEALNVVDTVDPAALVIGSVSDNTPDAVDRLREKTPVITCPTPAAQYAVQQVSRVERLVRSVTVQDLTDAFEHLGQAIRTVLIVDDERDIVRMYSRMVQTISESYELWTAYSGAEGLEIMQQRRPDVVLLDLEMPDVDGRPLLDLIHADDTLAKIPVILLSGKGTVDAIQPFTQGKISVTKPNGFQPLELVRCVETLLDAFTSANGPKP